jgi:hypothetical protein
METPEGEWRREVGGTSGSAPLIYLSSLDALLIGKTVIRHLGTNQNTSAKRLSANGRAMLKNARF